MSGCGNNVKEEVTTYDYNLTEIDYGFSCKISSIYGEKDIIVYERNILEFLCDSVGRCTLEGVYIPIDSIGIHIKRVVLGLPGALDNPHMKTVKLNYCGEVSFPDKLVISLLFSPSVKYEKSSEVRKQIIESYKELRNEFILNKFGKTMHDIYESDKDRFIHINNELDYIYPVRLNEVINELQ
jgi:hypothetical protein